MVRCKTNNAIHEYSVIFVLKVKLMHVIFCITCKFEGKTIGNYQYYKNCVVLNETACFYYIF